MTFQLPSLPYPLNSLEPHLSARVLELHHGRHHRKYVERVNALVEEAGLEGLSMEGLIQTQRGTLFDNAAQAWNHEFYWHSMAPSGTAVLDDSLGGAVRRDFGSIESLEKAFKQAALSVFGSGWAWLVRAPSGRLEVVTTKDADCPLREGKQPLLTCDVWEHAYYLDYENHRNRYVDTWWNLANWEFAAANFHRHDVVITR